MNIAINPIRDGGADTSGLLDYLFRPMGVAGVYASTAIYFYCVTNCCGRRFSLA